MTILGQLTKADYWEWRTTIEEQKTAKLELELATLKLGGMEKDIELSKLKAALYRINVITHHKEILKLRDDEYNRIKKQLEETIGSELKDCVIDEITYEVKRMD